MLIRACQLLLRVFAWISSKWPMAKVVLVTPVGTVASAMPPIAATASSADARATINRVRMSVSPSMA